MTWSSAIIHVSNFSKTCLSNIHRIFPGKDFPGHKEAATDSMELGLMPDRLLDNDNKDVIVDAPSLVPRDEH